MKADANTSPPKPPADVQYGKLPHDVITSGALSNLIRSDIAVYLAIAAHCCLADCFTAFPSIPKIARCAGISERTAHRSVDRLEELGLLTIARGGGLTHPNKYTLTTNPDTLSVTLADAKPCHPDVTVSRGKPCQTKTQTLTNRGRNPDKSGSKPCHPGVRGITEKQNNKKRHHAKKRATEKKPPKFSEEEIERIYAAYPRKRAKTAALKAIKKTLSAVAERGTLEPVTWLLDRVKKYAVSAAGQRGKYTPYPATWFNGGQYDDDEAEWAETNGGSQAASPARSRAEAGKYDGI